MATSQMSDVIQRLRRTLLSRDDPGLTDGQLLEDYIGCRDPAALAVLVRRHARMVWGVCCRVLCNYHDAEDAFQATFLVFVRKAAAIASRDLLANWLYGVAHQTALKARATAAKRQERERQGTQMPEPAVADQDLWRDLRPLLDEELSRLTEKYRAVIVLCDLEGKTRKEAARELGVPEGTVAGRLARARTMLARRITRRGLVLSGGALATAMAQNAASAGVPVGVLSSTIKAADLFAAGQAAAGVISARVASLTEGILTMSKSKAKLALGVVLAVGLLATGWGVYSNAADPVKEPENVGTGTPAAPVKEAKLTLPTGPAPQQVLASINNDGKLVIKTTVVVFRAVPGGINGGGFFPAPVPAPGGGAAPGGGPGGGGAGGAPGGGGGAGGAGGGFVPGGGVAPGGVNAQIHDLDEVEAIDTQGKKLSKKDVVNLLKEETVALASLFGQPVDPLHLRVIKPGTLIFVLPMPKGIVAPPARIVPAPLPGAPGNAPGAPGGLPPGVLPPAAAPPGNVLPGVPLPPPAIPLPTPPGREP